MITLRAYDKFAYGHTFKDYPWHHHDKQRKNGVPEEQCFVHAWIYLCLMSLSKILLNSDQSLPYCDENVEPLSKIENFVVDTYGSRDPDVTQLFSPRHRLKFSSTVGGGWSIFKAETKVESVEMSELPIIIQDVNAGLKEAVLASLNPEHSYYVLFDELDLGFSKESSDYALRLVGLLLAAKELNSAAKARGKRMTIGTFLRNDIYDHIKFEDKNKITENNVSSVFWDHGPTHKTLKGMMEKRFKTAMHSDTPIGWGDLFDESHEMPGRQKKYNYMLDRTFLRPRDMIKMCNEILIEYKKEIDPSGKFSNRHIAAAQISYSDYLYRELEDEIFKHVPVFREHIDILKKLESLQFTRKDMEEAFSASNYKSKQDDSVDEIMRGLFDFSVIGYYTAGGRGGGSDYVWKYKDERVNSIVMRPTSEYTPGSKTCWA